MLVPNKDFTELHCSNPSCGKKYLFEDIRRKIGNDVHNHEIGDLTTEGYLLSASHVLTELDDKRSGYLARKKKVVESEAPKEITKPRSFVMDKSPSHYLRRNDNG